MADPYTTQLSPEQEQAFQVWRARLPRDLQNDGDYDLRGAFLSSVKADGRLHMTDTYKKPNHMTFSDGSQYSTPHHQGGHWSDTGVPNALAPASGNSYVFWGSPENIKQHSVNALASYFDQYEPGNAFVAPINYNLPRRR